jgi:hypothetical protein
MASLLGLGVTSVAWTALVALEKTLPWRRTATWAMAAVLLALGAVGIAAPDAVPGLTLPDAMGGTTDATG